jgi:hypothetical protein
MKRCLPWMKYFRDPSIVPTKLHLEPTKSCSLKDHASFKKREPDYCVEMPIVLCMVMNTYPSNHLSEADSCGLQSFRLKKESLILCPAS